MPFEITGPVDWIHGIAYDPAWSDEEGPVYPRSEYLGINPAPGTVITAPFDGLAHGVYDGGFSMTVELPSQEVLELGFWFAGYHEFELLIQDESQVSAGGPIARYIGIIPWTPNGVGPGPDFEYPGIIQISTNGMPVYPVVPFRSWTNNPVEAMMSVDCRGCPLNVTADEPLPGYDIVVYETNTPEGPWEFVGRVKSFIVSPPEGMMSFDEATALAEQTCQPYSEGSDTAFVRDMTDLLSRAGFTLDFTPRIYEDFLDHDIWVTGRKCLIVVVIHYPSVGSLYFDNRDGQIQRLWVDLDTVHAW